MINNDYDEIINNAANNYNVDPSLIKGIIEVESSGNPAAVSNAGAQGLMQLMPDTFKSVSNGNPFNAADNINAGTSYLKSLLDKYQGDTQKALAAYNGGMGNVDKYGSEKYQNYVDKVLSAQTQYTGMGGYYVGESNTTTGENNGIFKNIIIVLLSVGVGILGVVFLVSAIGIDGDKIKKEIMKKAVK